ncbi:hypothetical protein PENFLA_c029G04051 [Penicillium flavigenum]|uniref:Trichodiene synthase n=1 Tax=Penicillium flavigenum TaxID=254877 RepID=A0A1V6SPU8_9EURO|nr:hypothetical protein PENFLA_c029G04051 [Penicillium flavigenum]
MRPIKDGDWISRIINIQGVLIHFLVAIMAVFFKWAREDPTSGEKISPGSPVLKRDLEEIVNGFLSDISYQTPKSQLDVGLKTRVQEALESHGVSRDLIAQMDRCINAAVNIAYYTYPFASREAQDAITSYVISIDDFVGDIIPELENYVSEVTLGQSHQHELLRGFTKHLVSMQRLFGNFGGDMIVKGALEGKSNGCTFYAKLPTIWFTPERKTGLAEVFAFFCFPEDLNPEDRGLTGYIASIPFLMLFLAEANDILSFYKEQSKAGDSGFIHDYSNINGLISLQTLRKLRVGTTEHVRKIRSIFSNDPVMTEQINQFIWGYVSYHVYARRYRLDELNVPPAIEAKMRL